MDRPMTAQRANSLPTMSDLEYSATQEGLILLVAMVRQYDFAGFLARIEHSHALAPMADPILYRKAGEALSDIEDLARAAWRFARAAATFHEKMGRV